MTTATNFHKLVISSEAKSTWITLLKDIITIEQFIAEIKRISDYKKLRPQYDSFFDMLENALEESENIHSLIGSSAHPLKFWYDEAYLTVELEEELISEDEYDNMVYELNRQYRDILNACK